MLKSVVCICGAVFLAVVSCRVHTASHLLAVTSRNLLESDSKLAGEKLNSRAENASAHQLSSQRECSYKPLRWVQKVCHLEDTLDFYVKYFGFEVVSHEEFRSACSESLEERPSGAYSRTILCSEGMEESESFCIELLYNYGVNRYPRGNDLRGLVFRASAYKGDLSLLEQDPSGRWYLETPDNHWIILVDDEIKTNEKFKNDVIPVASSKKISGIKFISLHVSNLNDSMKFYQSILGATVSQGADKSSAMCTWKHRNQTQESEGRQGSQVDVLLGGVGVELVELLPGEALDVRESQGVLVVETEESTFENTVATAREPQLTALGECPPPATSDVEEPLRGDKGEGCEGMEEMLLYDDDGHEYLLEKRKIYGKSVSIDKRSNIIDWAHRDKVAKSLPADQSDHFGPVIKALNLSNYEDLVEQSKSDVLINFSAPWCSICVRNHPVYQELAKRISKLCGDKIIFTVLDGSKIPICLVDNDELLTMLQWTKREGYPALFHLRSGGAGPVEFEGEWTIEGLTSFILTNATPNSVDLSLMDMTECDEI